jgi:CheY-like chemotaxis protein
MKKILIIEDNADIRENTAELLELHQYKVFTADSGYAGFEAAKKYKPDTIICDMVMPETDGQEFLKLAKEDAATRYIPLMFFSAGSLPAEIQKELIKGNTVLLEKPFTEEDLLKAIKECLEKMG